LVDWLWQRYEARVPDLSDRWIVVAGDFPDRKPARGLSARAVGEADEMAKFFANLDATTRG
jgi:hypothetical protein